jgi:UDP-N-acetylmuramate dehydrogenase
VSLKKIKSVPDVDLGPLTAIKIGGRARSFFSADSREEVQGFVKERSSDFYLLGGGSNLLIKDGVIDKAVLFLGRKFNYIRKDGLFVEAGASVLLPGLLKYCFDNQLGGLENLVGIPAKIGGLLAMNASAYGSAVSSVAARVEIVDPAGDLKQLDINKIKFSYRHSSLQGSVITRVWFKLKSQPDAKNIAAEFMKQRLVHQDFSAPSCGCVFKNPDKVAAGFLIEDCGFKGLKRNGAQVSQKHANFIINIAKASYNDVDWLIKEIKEGVFKKHGVVLEEEIKRWI